MTEMILSAAKGMCESCNHAPATCIIRVNGSRYHVCDRCKKSMQKAGW